VPTLQCVNGNRGDKFGRRAATFPACTQAFEFPALNPCSVPSAEQIDDPLDIARPSGVWLKSLPSKVRSLTSVRVASTGGRDRTG
jgi:hypothetical protein